VRLRIVAKILGYLLACMTSVGLVPLGMSWLDHQGNPHGTAPWLAMIGAGWGTAALLVWIGRRGRPEELAIREGLAVTTCFWVVSSLIAGLGIYLATPRELGPLACWFEAVSGLTTTGATIFGETVSVEGLDNSLLLWRSLLQWMGGIGIVVMSLTLLPLLTGGGGYQLYRAEVPGITTDRLAPRIADTARLLLQFYVAFTLVVAVALTACGADVFPAINHALTTVATGGFSTFDDSIEGFESSAAEWVTIAGMLLGGLNFGLLLAAIHGRPGRLLRSVEARIYLWLFALLATVVAATLALDGGYQDLHAMIRDACFQTASLLSSTGYATGHDVGAYSYQSWESWPTVAVMCLVFLMIFGGCTGSTAGGFKLARLLVLVRSAQRELRLYREPARVAQVRLGGRVLHDRLVLQVGAFAFLWLATWAAGTLALALCGHEFVTCAGASLSFTSNMGPGLGEVGPSDNYLVLGPVGHAIGSVLMILGRLEFFGVLLVIAPSSWRR